MTLVSAASSATISIDVALPPAPYPGLRPFEASEWPIFFGRERIVADLRRRLTRLRLVVVHGSSGCGKSSVIRAGLLPRLALEQEHSRAAKPGAPRMRPGGSPLVEPRDRDGRSVVTEPWRGPPSRSLDTYPDRPPHPERRPLTRSPEPGSRFGLGEGRQRLHPARPVRGAVPLRPRAVARGGPNLVEVLRGFAPGEDPGIHAILTMRSDHLGDCGTSGLRRAGQRTQYLLPRMDETACCARSASPRGSTAARSRWTRRAPYTRRAPPNRRPAARPALPVCAVAAGADGGSSISRQGGDSGAVGRPGWRERSCYVVRR